MVAVQPQGIADHRQRLVAVLFLLRKNAAENGMHSQRREHARTQPRSIDLLRSNPAR